MGPRKMDVLVEEDNERSDDAPAAGFLYRNRNDDRQYQSRAQMSDIQNTDVVAAVRHSQATATDAAMTARTVPVDFDKLPAPPLTLANTDSNTTTTFNHHHLHVHERDQPTPSPQYLFTSKALRNTPPSPPISPFTRIDRVDSPSSTITSATELTSPRTRLALQTRASNQISTPQLRLPAPHERRAKRSPISRQGTGLARSTTVSPPPSSREQPLHEGSATDTSTTNNSKSTKSEWDWAQEELADAIQTLRKATSLETAANERNNSRSPARGASKSLDETWLCKSRATRPAVPPIRSFRASRSTNRLVGGPNMYARGVQRHDSDSDDMEEDRDRTLRALEGFQYDVVRRDSAPIQSTTGDLFLDLARDDMTREARLEGELRAEQRRSRLVLPTSRTSSSPRGIASLQRSSTFQSPVSHRVSQFESVLREKHSSTPQSATPFSRQSSLHRPAPASAHPLSSPSSARYSRRHRPSPPGSTISYRETSYESPQSGVGGRRPSFPERSNLPSRLQAYRQSSLDSQSVSGSRRGSNTERSILDRLTGTPTRLHSLRQANLSQSMLRNHNPSPLVQNMDAVEANGVLGEGTESTGSTNAPSTVWDELDVLKSRIHRLELTGKMPSSSGAAVTNAMNNNRPRTATTTSTSLSVSPKRERGHSVGASDVHVPTTAGSEMHPLLHSALAKSRNQLPEAVYLAINATAQDALAIAAMMGKIGTPGPVSSAQSVIGSATGSMSDRQLRRKADSMCRSLTELCLVLSETLPAKAVPAIVSSPEIWYVEAPSAETPSMRVQAAVPNEDILAEAQSSSRGLSRLEKRRSGIAPGASLSGLLTPRPSPSISGDSSTTTTTQTASGTNRRTSLLMRAKRLSGVSQADDEESGRRAPSRAMTELSRIGSAKPTLRQPRESLSLAQKLSDRNSGNDRKIVIQSIERDDEDNRSMISVSETPQRRRMYSGLAMRQTLPTINTNTGNGVTPRRSYLDRTPSEREPSSTTLSPLSRLAEIRGKRASSIGLLNSGTLPRANTGLEGRTSSVPRSTSLGLRRTMTSISSAPSTVQHGYQ